MSLKQEIAWSQDWPPESSPIPEVPKVEKAEDKEYHPAELKLLVDWARTTGFHAKFLAAQQALQSGEIDQGTYDVIRKEYDAERDQFIKICESFDQDRLNQLFNTPIADINQQIKSKIKRGRISTGRPENPSELSQNQPPENLPIEERNPGPEILSSPTPSVSSGPETPGLGEAPEKAKESEPEYIAAGAGALRGRDPQTGNKGTIVRADPDYAGGVVEWELVGYDGLSGDAILERPSPEGRGIDRIPMKQGFLYAINQDIAQAEQLKRSAGGSVSTSPDVVPPSRPEPMPQEPAAPEPDNQPAQSAPEWKPGDNIAHGFGRKFKPIDILSLDEIEAAYRFSIQTGENIEYWQKERDGYLARRKASEVYRRLLDIKSQLSGLNDQLTLAQSAYDAVQEESRKRRELGIVVQESAIEQDYQKRKAEITSQYEVLQSQIEDLNREKAGLERSIDPSLRDRLKNVYESAQTVSSVWGDIKKRFKSLAVARLWEYRKSEVVRKGLEDFELIADSWYRELATQESSQKIIDRIDQIVEQDAEAALTEAIKRHVPANSEPVQIGPRDLEQFKDALRQELRDISNQNLRNDLFGYTDILRNNFKQSWWSRNVYGRMSPLLERLGF